MFIFFDDDNWAIEKFKGNEKGVKIPLVDNLPKTAIIKTERGKILGNLYFYRRIKNLAYYKINWTDNQEAINDTSKN